MRNTIEALEGLQVSLEKTAGLLWLIIQTVGNGKDLTDNEAAAVESSMCLLEDLIQQARDMASSAVSAAYKAANS